MPTKPTSMQQSPTLIRRLWERGTLTIHSVPPRLRPPVTTLWYHPRTGEVYCGRDDQIELVRTLTDLIDAAFVKDGESNPLRSLEGLLRLDTNTKSPEDVGKKDDLFDELISESVAADLKNDKVAQIWLGQKTGRTLKVGSKTFKERRSLGLAVITLIKDINSGTIPKVLFRPGRPLFQKTDIPLLSDAELPPPPTDRRASKVERRIKASELHAALDNVEADLATLHDPVLKRFQKVLDTLHEDGKACRNFEDNIELARRVLEMADRFGIRLIYTKETDIRGKETSEQHEVRMRCIEGNGAVGGIFQLRSSGTPAVTISSSPAW